MTSSSPASPSAGGSSSSSSLQIALQQYGQHVFDYISQVKAEMASTTTAVADPLLALSSPSSTSKALGYVRQGEILVTLQQYRLALVGLLRELGVDALDTFASSSFPPLAVAASAGSSSVAGSGEGASSSSFSSSFSVPTLISSIDALLPAVAFSGPSSSAGAAASAPTMGAPSSSSASSSSVRFSTEEKSEILKRVILNHEVQSNLLKQIDFASATATSAAATTAISGGKRSERDEEADSGGADDASKRKAMISESGTTTLTRTATVFVSAAGGGSGNLTAAGGGALSSSASAAVTSSCNYEGLLSDYSVNIANLTGGNLTVAKRQEMVTTMIDVIMRSIITVTCNTQVSTTTGAAANGTAATSSAAAGGNTNSTSNTAANTNNTNNNILLVPPFHAYGIPYRHLQVTAQGGGSVAATFAPFKFL